MSNRLCAEGGVFQDSHDDAVFSHPGDYPSHNGPVTVIFRLVSMDGTGSPDVTDMTQPITPLNTPYTQSPATSPNMRADHSNYGPGLVPTMGNQGVYFTAPVGQFYQDENVAANFGKPRALSAEMHHSPHFQYQPPTHRLSFSVPVHNEKDGVGPFVSAEMLLSAMPERYDD